MSIPHIGVKVAVTREMLMAARDHGISEGRTLEHTDERIAQIYKAMRALEPGTADPGVMQHHGARHG